MDFTGLVTCGRHRRPPLLHLEVAFRWQQSVFPQSAHCIKKLTDTIKARENKYRNVRLIYWVAATATRMPRPAR
jgi:hypothetical protein